jgi:hypothetical protein
VHFGDIRFVHVHAHAQLGVVPESHNRRIALTGDLLARFVSRRAMCNG